MRFLPEPVLSGMNGVGMTRILWDLGVGLGAAAPPHQRPPIFKKGACHSEREAEESLNNTAVFSEKRNVMLYSIL